MTNLEPQDGKRNSERKIEMDAAPLSQVMRDLMTRAPRNSQSISSDPSNDRPGFGDVQISEQRATVHIDPGT